MSNHNLIEFQSIFSPIKHICTIGFLCKWVNSRFRHKFSHVIQSTFRAHSFIISSLFNVRLLSFSIHNFDSKCSYRIALYSSFYRRSESFAEHMREEVRNISSFRISFFLSKYDTFFSEPKRYRTSCPLCRYGMPNRNGDVVEWQ